MEAMKLNAQELRLVDPEEAEKKAASLPRHDLYLVIENVFNKPVWNLRGIERFADRDCVVDAVVMTQNASGFSLRPGESWLFKARIKVFAV